MAKTTQPLETKPVGHSKLGHFPCRAELQAEWGAQVYYSGWYSGRDLASRNLWKIERENRKDKGQKGSVQSSLSRYQFKFRRSVSRAKLNESKTRKHHCLLASYIHSRGFNKILKTFARDKCSDSSRSDWFELILNLVEYCCSINCNASDACWCIEQRVHLLEFQNWNVNRYQQ